MTNNQKPILFSYWRSSCSWRVRIALAIKEVDYDYRVIDLLSKEALNDPEFVRLNPAKKVPVLIVNGQAISESLAIIEYLEEAYPEKPSLFPKDLIKRAQSRAIALHVTAGIQPLQNLQVIQKLNAQEAGSAKAWCQHWIQKGLEGLEELLQKSHGRYSVGDEVSVADLVLPSMLYNAKRFNVDLTSFPIASQIDANLAILPAFIKAIPDNQPDAGLNA